jgi:hypothetical protein
MSHVLRRSKPPCIHAQPREKNLQKLVGNILTYAEIIYFRQLILALGIPEIQIF